MSGTPHIFWRNEIGLFGNAGDEDLQEFALGDIVVNAGTMVLSEGTRPAQIYVVSEGIGLRYKLLNNGRRQVISVLFPSDIIGLQGVLLGEMRYSVETVTSMRLMAFEQDGLLGYLGNDPERALDAARQTAIDGTYLANALVSLGQRSARERLAWAILHLFKRAEACGMTYGATMNLPIRQKDLADALGLSLVHTNKTLAILKNEGLINYRQGRLTILDEARLTDLALADASDFDVPRKTNTGDKG